MFCVETRLTMTIFFVTVTYKSDTHVNDVSPGVQSLA
jgi:hypothetical protein